MASFKFFQTARRVGLPGIAARALPIITPRLEAAMAAGVAGQALRMFVDQTAQQAEVGTAHRPLLLLAGFGAAQLGLEQAVEPQQRRVVPQSAASEGPRRRRALLDAQ